MTKRRISKAAANKLSKSKVARAATERDGAAIANVHAETNLSARKPAFVTTSKL
jgi:hypothetical protein